MQRKLALKLGIFSIDPLFFAAIFCAVCFGYFEMFLVSFLSVLIHECFHVIAAAISGVGISKVEVHPFGVCAVLENGFIKSSEKEFFIAFLGPFSSLVLAAAMLFIPLRLGEYIFFINLLICAVNLLPALPLDGGRMLKAVLTYKFGILRAFFILQKCSRVIIALLAAASLIALIFSRLNFTYILISAFLFGNLKNERQCVTLLTLREILENPQKISSIKKTEVFTAQENESARKILRFVSYDYYITVNILVGGKIAYSLTETQILHGLLELGIAASFSDIAKMPQGV